MAVFTHTDTHVIIGQLDDTALKMVQTTVVPTSAGNGTATPITISPLVRIKAWNFFPRDPGTTPTTFVTAFGGDTATTSGTNVIYITPAADAQGGVLEIISVGD